MDIKLLHGDCLELMKDIPDKSVDLTVTSPPYDNLRSYNDNISQWSFEKFKTIAKELYRVTKQGGVVVWIVGDATVKGSETGTSFKQALYFKETGFNLHDTMIYRKKNPMPYRHNRYQPCFEYMFVLSKGKPNIFNALLEPTKNAGVASRLNQRQTNGNITAGNGKGKPVNDKKYRDNIWEYGVGCGVTTTDKYAFDHPAMFPEKLAEDHIISWSNEGDTVLDPFMGSGTTGKMALLNSRNFIGIELDDKYFEIAKRRISEARNKPEQLTIW